MIVKSVAVTSDDCQQLDHVLVGIGLDVPVLSLDLAADCQALTKNSVHTLLVLNEGGSA